MLIAGGIFEISTWPDFDESDSKVLNEWANDRLLILSDRLSEKVIEGKTFPAYVSAV